MEEIEKRTIYTPKRQIINNEGQNNIQELESSKPILKLNEKENHVSNNQN